MDDQKVGGKQKDLHNKILEEANEAEFEPLYQCTKGCGKSFKKESLVKHEKICAKVFLAKRKKFDIRKKRIEELEVKPRLRSGKLP